MKILIFDSSSIISIATNNLLGILKNLKKYYRGEFLISEEVSREIINDPLQSKRFKLEALQVADYISQGNIKVYNKRLDNKTNYLMTLANNTFQANNNNIIILHRAEVESLALALELKADCLVIDERTTRLLVEDESKLKNLLERKLHTKIKINKENLNYLKKEIKEIKILRSSELMIIAYELGLFGNYDVRKFVKGNIQKEILEGILWGLRLKGCALSTEEIKDALRFEGIRQ